MFISRPGRCRAGEGDPSCPYYCRSAAAETRLLFRVEYFRKSMDARWHDPATHLPGNSRNEKILCNSCNLSLPQSCKRASFQSPNPAQARCHKPVPAPSRTFNFGPRFRSEKQICRVSQNMRKCRGSKNVVHGYLCRYTGLTHSK